MLFSVTFQLNNNNVQCNCHLICILQVLNEMTFVTYIYIYNIQYNIQYIYIYNSRPLVHIYISRQDEDLG